MTLQLACVPPLPLCLTAPATPENGASTCPQGPGALNWPNAQYATNYDVYFGTTPNPPFVTNTNLTSYSVSNLALGTYYWKIIPKNSAGSATECVVWSFTVSGNILYVKANATGNNNGSSWTDAYTDLQSALNSTCPGVTEIWVAAGTYKPTSGTDRSISFSMKNGVGIYGGFNGTETQLSQRNWATNVTTLSGDIGMAGNNGDNSLRVITNNGLNSSAILDGFTIRDGYSTSDPNAIGAGGMRNLDSSPTISNCIFRNNYSLHPGGAVSSYNSSPVFTNCIFTQNSTNFAGGAIYTQVGNPSFINCTFVDNSNRTISSNFSATNTTLINCIVWGNTPSGINIYSNQGATTSVTNSIVQGGYPGNLDADPLFVNAASGDFRLQACSPAINAGSNVQVSGITSDLDGNPRFYNNGTVDMGAYEFQSTPPTFVTCYRDSDNDSFGNLAMSQVFCNTCGTGYVPNGADCNDANQAINPFAAEVCDGADNNCNTQTDEGNVCCPSGNVIYVKANATGNNTGSSWTDAYTDLQSALNSTCTGVTEIWVAAGTYKPTSGTDRNISFVMKNGVAIYGGFNGTETQLSQRNWANNLSILSGDIGTVNLNTDNSHRVISNNGVNSSSILSGFIIRDGYNPILSGNSGDAGGIWNDNSSPIFSNCIIRNNYSRGSGGGVSANNSSPTYINCLFTENSSDNSGGAIRTQSGTTTLINCTIVNNRAIYGGAIGGNLSSTNHIVKNCIIWGNTAPNFNPIDNNQNSSSTISNSIVQGGWSGTGNLNANPLFVNAGGDFRLQACSPAIDAGSDADNSTTKDLNGNSRKIDLYSVGEQIDMGAYEAQSGDPQAPSISCPNTQTLVLGGSCSASLPDYTSLATTSDNCGVQSVTQSPTAGTPVSGTGNMMVTLTVTDVNGLTNTCTFTVTKVDNTAPTISCPVTQTLVLGANCTATLPNYTSLSTTGDNCGVQSVTQSPTAGTPVSGTGNMMVTLTVTDVNGLTNTCTFTVTKVDNTAPTISCPVTQTLVLGANCTATLPNYTSLSTTGDNCGVQSVTQSPTAGTPVSGAGNMMVTLTVTDVNGRTNTCTFTVTKVDNTPPAVVCKNTTVFIENTGTYTLQAADVFNATASSDNCSGALTVTNISPATVSCSQLNQTIPVTVTVQDGSGNTATCTAQITVQEGTALPVGWGSNNIGNANGSAGYKACSFNGSFTVSANGFSMATSDVLHFASQLLCGNGEITARVASVSGGGWGGVMIRENLMPGAKKVSLKTQLSSIIRREVRSVANGAASILNFNRPQHAWLRLVRSGSTFTGYTSLNGTTWSFAFSTTVSMSGCVQVGVFAESINANATTTATFSNVSVTGSGNNLAADLANVNAPSENGEQVRVFPNPTTGEVTIDLDLHAGKPGTIQVFNALGALTTQARLIPGNPETHCLHIGDIAGVYTVVIQLEDSKIVRRVVVQSE